MKSALDSARKQTLTPPSRSQQCKQRANEGPPEPNLGECAASSSSMLAFVGCHALAVPLEGGSAPAAHHELVMEKAGPSVLSSAVTQQRSLNAEARARMKAQQDAADEQKCTLPTHDCKLNAEKKRVLLAFSAPHGPAPCRAVSHWVPHALVRSHHLAGLSQILLPGDRGGHRAGACHEEIHVPKPTSQGRPLGCPQQGRLAVQQDRRAPVLDQGGVSRVSRPIRTGKTARERGDPGRLLGAVWAWWVVFYWAL